jgi:uncharacterized protein
LSDSEIINFLSAGASYGLPEQPVDRLETHCSVVFLVGEHAYKLKRRIAFSALDYTSLQKREAACRREVALNRRTAPDLYLGVQAIRRDQDGKLGFDGEGSVVDWVVVMRRFEQADLLDHLADENRLTPRLIRELAAEIARFHATAEVTRAFGGAQGLRQAIAHNRRDHLTVEPVLGCDVIDRLHVTSISVLDRLGMLLDRRRTSGRVRVCHGDLRLANICLYRGRPTLFDAIEFADELSCVDVLYDLAFLLMDLDQRGLRVQANFLFNRYLDATGETDGLPALPLMVSVRAGIRAYSVAASSLRNTDQDRSRHLAAAARTLMQLAASSLEPSAPRLIAIGGGTAAGRSAIADDLAPRFAPTPGARVVRSGPQTTARADASIIGDAAEIVAAGYTAILDAPFDDIMPAQRIAELADEKHVPFVGLWLGNARTAPPKWDIVDRDHAVATIIAAARRLTGVAASPHESGDPSPPRREAGGTYRKRR